MCDDDDWPDEGSGPQSPAEDPHYFKREDLLMRADLALSDLRRAKEGEELLHGVSCGLSAIQELVDCGERLDCTEMRAALLRELARVRAALRMALPDFDLEEIANGIDAAIGQVMHAAESEQRRCKTSPAELELLSAHARILRNDLHTASLLAGIDHLRSLLHSGQLAPAAFANRIRRDFARMASNEIMNGELRAQISGRPAPVRELRLVA